MRMNACRVLWLVLLASGWAHAQPQPMAAAEDYGAESHRLVSSPDEIISILKNGMTVIVRRVPSPAVAVRAYAHTGGIYEGKWLGGGLSHLLEHLVAGGSNERRTEEQNRNLLQKIGNNSNAYTTYDHTCYFVNTTPPHLDEAVDLVAGWMLGAKITPAEYAREYEVVQREVEMNKGEPGSVFWLLSQSNRYRVHPARVPVIGYQAVIQGLSRDDVYGYYKLAYQPNNLLFAVAGDIDPEKALAAIRKNVAEAKPGREFPHDLPAEPPVSAPRSVVATFPKLGQARLELGFPSVKLDHPDMYPLDVLATILGDGESALLIQELRDKRQLVSGVGVGDFTPHYADGTFTISMELDPDKVDAATKAVLEQIEKIKAAPVDAGRLARAKTLVRASRVKSKQTAEDIIGSMAMDYLSTGDAHFSDRYVERMQQVTAEQIMAAAKKYLLPEKLLTTALIPAESLGAGGLPKAEELLRHASPSAPAKPAAGPARVTRLELDGGVILLHKQLTSSPIVEVRMYSLGGLTAEDEKTNGIGNLTMEMVPRGTRTRSADQISEFFDSIGGDISTETGNNSWYWNMTCMKEDFSRAMGVYADIVKNPTFPDAELAPVKQRVLAGIEGQDADWHSQAMRFFKKQYFGPLNSPYQFVSVGQKSLIEQATAAQLREWYQSKVLAGRKVLAIYGDVTLDEAQDMARQHLSIPSAPLASAGQRPAANPLTGPASIKVERVEVQKTDQPLAGVVIGFRSRSVIGDADAFPISVLDTMASGFDYPTGYMFEILRGRGLVYVVHAYDSPGRSASVPGAFIVYAGCDPKNVNEVVDVILESMARCQGTAADMNAEWFDRSKQLITTSDALSNETAAQQASTAALDELYGLGYDYHAQFPAKINAVTIDQVREVAKKKLWEAVVTVSTPAPDVVKKDAGTRNYPTFPPVDLTPRGVQHDTGK